MEGFQYARGGGSQGNQGNFYPRRGGATRGLQGGPPQGRGGFDPGRGGGLAGRDSPQGQRDCVYCYMEYRNGEYCDYKHPINNCPNLTNMYGGANHEETEHEEDSHPFEDIINDFYNEDDDAEYAQEVLSVNTSYELATSSPCSPRSFSRSDSTSSLASPMGSLSALSPLPVSHIENLTNDYQELLKQATREIKKLNLDVKRMEQEQAKILQENVDLALETKGLILDQKAWKKDEQVK